MNLRHIRNALYRICDFLILICGIKYIEGDATLIVIETKGSVPFVQKGVTKMLLNLRKFVFMILLGFSVSANSAPAYVYVNDMSLLSYQLVADGNVFFRNLNTFNPSVTGCCYAFVLNKSTPAGKSQWATILMKMATKQPLNLYVTESNPPTSGAPAIVDHLGNW